ncbi:ornithine cyclodeaminase family protein [Frondihabitans australicus]|uniref:Ornithine cyclodeaminase/alanine dehydrogenase n=1 Tax=Frondihabitans australicus TaxID=386892 RepID=A0A495IFI6_9MICO|nr:ornithine cyclodeaminase family protein [Frondihabitans australicus]RKR74767.1 ornithine cyclodeaminase/alanine dehydrogenase [Frondihabitans australicus]
MTLVLGAADIARLLPLVDVVAAVEAIHRDLGTGAMEQLAPAAMTGGDDGVFLPMTARSDRLGLVAVKLMADIPSNASRGLPSQRSTLVVSSSRTGECLAVLDGGGITRARTAATSVVATTHLANPGGHTLGLIGAGNLAVEHVRAFAAATPFDRVVVWSRSSDTVDRFLRELGSQLPGACVIASSPKEVAHEADVLCTLTPSVDPVVLGEWLHDGQHVNAVGARPRATHRELDGAAMARGTLVVDSRPTAFSKSGDLVQAIADGALAADVAPAELGEVVAGTAIGRTSSSDITVFDSTGIAAQDLAVAAVVIELARQGGLGAEHRLSAADLLTGVEHPASSLLGVMSS